MDEASSSVVPDLFQLTDQSSHPVDRLRGSGGCYIPICCQWQEGTLLNCRRRQSVNMLRRRGRGIAYLRALSDHCQLTYSGFGHGPRSDFVPTEEVSEQPGFRLKVSFDPCPGL